MPEEQSAKDLEFFSAPMFVKQVVGVKLTFSVSLSRNELTLDLERERIPVRLLRYALSDVVAISVESDADGRPWLRAM